jgi:hypothetical protein
VEQTVGKRHPPLYVTTGKLLLHFVIIGKYILPLTAILVGERPKKHSLPGELIGQQAAK